MDRVKRVLAILALLCMLAFVMSCMVLMGAGKLQEQMGWVYGTMSAFLMFGLPALLIDWLQKRAAKKKAEEGGNQ